MESSINQAPQSNAEAISMDSIPSYMSDLDKHL